MTLRFIQSTLVLFTLLLSCCSFQQNDLTRDQKKFLTATRWQIGKTTSYHSRYEKLTYPNGDLPLETGVCTDVVIRALRISLGIDLQTAIHEDMKTHFSQYPQSWGLVKPDSNIDHRRVPNQRTYFRRHGWELPLKDFLINYRPGDILTCAINGTTSHIMVVSDRRGPSGNWMLIHNVGIGVIENDVLFKQEITGPITGHYRIPHSW